MWCLVLGGGGCTYLMGLNNILIYMRFGLISFFYFWLWRSFTWMLLIRNVSSVTVGVVYLYLCHQFYFSLDTSAVVCLWRKSFARPSDWWMDTDGLMEDIRCLQFIEPLRAIPTFPFKLKLFDLCTFYFLVRTAFGYWPQVKYQDQNF